MHGWSVAVLHEHWWVRDGLVCAFKGAGWSARECFDCYDLVSNLKAEVPDVIVIGGEGDLAEHFDVLAYVASRFPTIRMVLLTTAIPPPSSGVRWSELGVSAWLDGRRISCEDVVTACIGALLSP